MKKKRVLFLIESFIVGGAEKVLIDIVNNLNPEKYDITVCSVYKHSVYKGYNKTFDKPFKPHIKYKHLINNQHHWLYLIFNFLLARFPNIIYHLFIGNKYDTTIAFYEGLPTYWIANAKLKSGRKIAWLHTSAKLAFNKRSLSQSNIIQNTYKKFNKIVAVSKGVAESYQSILQNINIEIIYNPVDTNKILELSKCTNIYINKKRVTFISIGRITEAKGYERWLKIACKLINENFQFDLWIIGGGDDSNLAEYINKNQLKDHIKLWGHQANPYPFLQIADYFICPSYIEGLSTVTIEATILKKAIIVTDCPGMKEILGNNQYGKIVNNNEVALYNTIKEILTNPHIMDSHITALHKIENLFNIENTINKIENELL